MKTKQTRKLIESFYVTPQSGEDLLQTIFGSKKFIECIFELLKNANDWFATSIKLFFIKNELHIVDNGIGLSVENMQSICNVGTSTADPKKGQTGKFGSGQKYMLFSQCTAVTIRFRRKEDLTPCVWELSFTAEEYERKYALKEVLKFDCYELDPETWPHSHSHGCHFIYTLKNPTDRSVKRGSELAKALSQELTHHKASKITVEGKPLPEKEIIGRLFSHVEQTNNRHYPALSPNPVIFELSRPKRKLQNEGITMTSTGYPEVSFAQFLSVLSLEDRDRMPRVYHDAHGHVETNYFKNYVSDSRDSFSERIADVEETSNLIDLFIDLAPAVAEALCLKYPNSSVSENDSLVLDNIAKRANQAYDPDGLHRDIGTDGTTIAEPPVNGSAKSKGSTSHADPFQITSKREYEIGETVEIIVKINNPSLSLDKLTWITEFSGCINPVVTPKGMTLHASATGRNFVTVTGAGHVAKAEYVVVLKRMFEIQPTNYELNPGKEIKIIALNTDKLEGRQVIWTLDGVGELVPEGNRAIYTAPQVIHGMPIATVYATDSGNNARRCECLIKIVPVPGQQKLLCIGDDVFSYSISGPSFSLSENEPIYLRRNYPYNTLYLNSKAPVALAAKERGELESLLIQAISLAYPRFLYQHHREKYYKDYQDESQIPALLDKMRQETLSILETFYKDS